MATIVKRSNGQWQSKIRRRGYPPVNRTFSTKAKAERWSRMIESEMDQGAYVSRVEAESTTLIEALNRYLKEVTPHKKGAKQEGERINVWKKHPLAFYFLSNLRSTDFAEYRDKRLADGRSSSTIRNELRIISHLFTIARKEWGMESLANPIENIRMPKMPPGRDRRLNKGEEKQLLGSAEYPLKEIITLAIETGMRRGEILDITWENVNLKRSTIELPDTKNGDSRIIPLSKRVKTTVKGLPTQISGKVFPDLTGDDLSLQFRNLCKGLEIEELRFHDLRHEATSRLFEKGLDLMEVASITGHKTLHMLKRYTHLRAEDLAKKLG